MADKKEKMMPKKEALKSLIKAMKMMHLEKVKGYGKADGEIPEMVAKFEKPEDDESEESAPDEDEDEE